MNEAKDWELIHVYTRRQAIEDGVLVDVTAMAKTVGFSIPVALTAGAWAACVAVPRGVTGQDQAGRLRDVLWMCRFHVRLALGESTIPFKLHVRNDERAGYPQLVTLKAVCGPDDDASPRLTIMLPDED